MRRVKSDQGVYRRGARQAETIRAALPVLQNKSSLGVPSGSTLHELVQVRKYSQVPDDKWIKRRTQFNSFKNTFDREQYEIK